MADDTAYKPVEIIDPAADPAAAVQINQKPTLGTLWPVEPCPDRAAARWDGHIGHRANFRPRPQKTAHRCESRAGFGRCTRAQRGASQGSGLSEHFVEEGMKGHSCFLAKERRSPEQKIRLF
jgi:hypothetical protein